MHRRKSHPLKYEYYLNEFSLTVTQIRIVRRVGDCVKINKLQLRELKTQNLMNLHYSNRMSKQMFHHLATPSEQCMSLGQNVTRIFNVPKSIYLIFNVYPNSFFSFRTFCSATAEHFFSGD